MESSGSGYIVIESLRNAQLYNLQHILRLRWLVAAASIHVDRLTLQELLDYAQSWIHGHRSLAMPDAKVHSLPGLYMQGTFGVGLWFADELLLSFGLKRDRSSISESLFPRFAPVMMACRRQR
jgi:hypothetical protein